MTQDSRKSTGEGSEEPAPSSLSAGSLGLNPVLAWLIRVGPGYGVALIFVLGPVVMWATHFTYLATGLLDGVERPLTYFASATWGDALLLPAIGYLCISALRDMAEHSPAARLSGGWARVPIIWAVAGTATLHALWLSDASNENWTQPAGGSWLGSELTLNSAGWLHAAFFVAMQWLIAEFTLRLLFTLLSARKHGVADGAEGSALGRVMAKTNGVLLASLAFSVLLLRDYWPQVTASEPGQTWTWFLAPAAVALLSLGANGLLFRIVAHDVQARRGAGMSSARSSLGIVVVAWSILLIVSSAALIWLLAPTVVTALGLLVGGCVALAIMAAVNVWAEVFWMQRRRPTGPVDALALIAIATTVLAGFVASLYLIVVHEPVGSLAEILVPCLWALVVALVPCAVAAGIGIALEGYASLSDDSLARHCHDDRLYCLGVEPPQHDIVQNVMQFGALLALLPLYSAAYVLLGEPLMIDKLDPGTQVALLFGYAGVVVAAVTFPLYQNMQYVRDLERQKADLGGPPSEHVTERSSADELRRAQSAESARLEKIDHLDADKSFTMGLSITVGVVAVLSAMWLWITVLDLVLAAA